MPNKSQPVVPDMTWGTVARIIEIVAVMATLIWTIAFLRADVDANSEWNQRQDQRFELHEKISRETFVRQDVLSPQLKQMRTQLDRIEEKLDDKND